MNKFTKRARYGISAVVAATALVIVPAVSASAAIVPTVGSAHPLYLTSGEDGSQIPAGSSQVWGADVFASPDPTDPDFNSVFAVPAGTTSVRTFISQRGHETEQAFWHAYGPLALTPSGILLANLKPNGNTSAGAATPSGANAVANAGGDYSLGLAFLNGNTVIEADFTYITVVANPVASVAQWTFDTPVGPSAPLVTTDPASQSAVVGGNVTFTAAASGTPTPTVKWQSAPVATSTWTDVAGATSASLTVSNVQLAATGTQYRAVFTNAGGSVNSAVAVLTVTPAAVEEPVAGDAGELPHVDVADGETSLVLDNTGIPAGTYGVWAWSTPTQLPNATVDANGDVTIDLAGLTTGTHTIALVDIATNDVVAWLTITLSSTTETVTDLTVDVTTSNKFALEGVAAALDLGSAARGASTSADLPAFTVTDDRNLLPGWDLTSKVDDFVNASAGNDVIAKGALSIEPRKVGPAVAGISAKTVFTASTSNLFAEGLANSSTPSTGTQFDAKLTFNVPATAKAGTYASKLTLTLTSK
jgi:hypothetical protein